MKKSVITITSIVIAVIVALIIFFAIPKTGATNLVININDISLKLDEKSKVNYSSSISDAIITMVVEDDDIAQLTISSNGFYITGSKVGNTYLTLTGRYGDQVIEKVAKVSVLGTTNVDENEPNDDKPNTNKPNIDESNDEVNKPTDSEDNNKDANDLIISFSNLNRCKIENNNIFLTENDLAIFSINANVNIEGKTYIYSNSENLIISYLQDIGDNTYSIKALSTGEYQLCIEINGIESWFNVVVSE